MQIAIGDPKPSTSLPHGVRFGKNSLTLPEGLDFDQWKSIGMELRSCHLALNWWVGDWLAYGQATYKDNVHGHRLENGVLRFASELLGIKEGTLKLWKYVCSSVNSLCRHNNLTFSNAYEIACIAPEHHIDMWVQRLEAEPLGKLELRKTMRLFYATEPIDESDGPVESFLEDTRQWVRDFRKRCDNWSDDVRAGYARELLPVFEYYGINV